MDLAALRTYPFTVTQAEIIILIPTVTQLARREPSVYLVNSTTVLVGNLSKDADKTAMSKVVYLAAP